MVDRVVIGEFFNKIYDIPLLYCAIIAVVLPFAVIAVGYLIELVGEAFITILGMIFSPSIACGIANYIFIPGVMLHELSHAFVALITGAKVTEIALFKKDGDSLGHVNFINRGNAVAVAIQNIFISSAPMYIGALIVFGCFFWIGLLPASLIWLKIILGYIGVSMFFHMTMSKADIKVYIKGVPLFIVLIFIIAVVFRLSDIVA